MTGFAARNRAGLAMQEGGQNLIKHTEVVGTILELLFNGHEVAGKRVQALGKHAGDRQGDFRVGGAERSRVGGVTKRAR